MDRLPDLLTTSEVAKLLGVTPAAISQWLLDGVFPHAFKINPNRHKSPWRIPRADVEAFIAARRAQRGFFRMPVHTPERV